MEAEAQYEVRFLRKRADVGDDSDDRRVLDLERQDYRLLNATCGFSATQWRDLCSGRAFCFTVHKC